MERTNLRESIDQAVRWQRQGEWEKALGELQRIEGETRLLPKEEAMPLLRLIRHYEGRFLQAAGEHLRAEEKLQMAKEIAIELGDPVGLGYSTFQWFINRDYGGIFLSPEELRETKKALWGWMDATKNPRDLGDVFQNLAYIEQRKGDIEKAIWFYQVAEAFRGIANDQRGFALTWARLGECYKEIGNETKPENMPKKLWVSLRKLATLKESPKLRRF